jgi:nucleotide-binding universal stress UspA family protein
MYQKILVPLDGSELAEQVLPHVCELASIGNSEIVLVRVLMYLLHDYAWVDPTYSLATESDLVKAEAISYLTAVAKRLAVDGLRVSVEAVDDPVAESILECAERVHADIIAMSTHGRSGVSRWLMGSVADRVVCGAKVPVLLIRPAAKMSANSIERVAALAD